MPRVICEIRGAPDPLRPLGETAEIQTLQSKYGFTALREYIEAPIVRLADEKMLSEERAQAENVVAQQTQKVARGDFRQLSSDDFRTATDKLRHFEEQEGNRELLRVAGIQLPEFTPPPREPLFIVVGEVEAEYLQSIREDRELIAAVYEDARIEGFPIDCDSGIAKGSIDGVRSYLGVDALEQRGITGQGIGIAICDSGVDGNQVNVAGGWAPPGEPGPGVDVLGHGSMTGWNASQIAQNAQIFDLGVLKGASTLSNAIQAFQWAIDNFLQTGQPQVLSNSWGMYQEAWEPNYVRNPNHPFIRKVEEATNLGITVTFAAGNCGSFCPDGRCATDAGPGRSIWGANALRDVITVGSANLNEEWIGSSSEGPSPFWPIKPNVCGLSNFEGYFPKVDNSRPADTGTSTACPVVSGAVALLKQVYGPLSPQGARLLLQITAKNNLSTGYNTRMGYGIVNAWQAATVLDGIVT